MTKSLVVKVFWGSFLGLGKPGGAPQPLDGELTRATAWDER
jgi:hypothetical protein